MQLTGPACLGKTPARSDCPVALVLASRREAIVRGLRLFAAVNSLAVQVPGVSLCGCDLLVEGVWVGLLVLDAVEVLAVDVGERRAVAGMAEEQVEHRPDE
jgi:hypothetical protein